MSESRNAFPILLQSLLIFCTAAFVLFIETHLLIPYLSQKSGQEPVVFWFLIAGLGMFLPMLIASFFLLRNEGLSITKDTWNARLRFKPMCRRDWLWSIGGVIVIGLLSAAILKLLEVFTGKAGSSPSFMYFEPLTAGRYWILLLWIPYWLLNIMGEEILWRGVLLPRQESVLGKMTWIVHGFFWGIFHIAFGWQLLLTLLPILFIQPYIVQQRKNSWTGVVIHALVNGPSFIAISFGII